MKRIELNDSFSNLSLIVIPFTTFFETKEEKQVVLTKEEKIKHFGG